MKLNNIEVLNALSALNVPYETRGAVLALAVARVVGYGLQLPANAVDNAGDFFNASLRANAEQIVGTINETVVLDIDAAMAMIYTLWKFRYQMVFDPFNPAVMNFFDAIVRVGEAELTPALTNALTTYGNDQALINTLAKHIWGTTVFEAGAIETQEG